MLKVKVFGYRGKINSTERIERELVRQGCELVEKNPDLLIEMCGLYEKAQEFYQKSEKKPIRLYNLLDVNNKDINFYNQAKWDYINSEIATTISYTVKEQIRNKFQTDKNIYVIGFPIRPVTFKKYLKGYPFLYVGRFYDLNKRTFFIQPVLKTLNLDPIDNLIVVGMDKPSYDCFYQGIVDDNILNELYNAAEFVFLLSKKEGIGLTAVEGIISSAIPLLCNDNEIVQELGLQDFSALPSSQSIVQLIEKIRKNIHYYWDKMDELRPKFERQFSVETVVKNMLELYNDYIKENPKS